VAKSRILVGTGRWQQNPPTVECGAWFEEQSYLKIPGTIEGWIIGGP
jgi:hypothetical protein